MESAMRVRHQSPRSNQTYVCMPFWLRLRARACAHAWSRRGASGTNKQPHTHARLSHTLEQGVWEVVASVYSPAAV